MESSYSGIDALRPWRTRAFVAAGVAAFELVLLLVAAIVLFGPSLKRHVRETAVSRAVAAPPVAAQPVKTRRARPAAATRDSPARTRPFWS